MAGREYLNGIEEIGYYEAIEENKAELECRGLKKEDIYEEEKQSLIFDEPVYPRNAELYGEFCEEDGTFDIIEYTSYLFKIFATKMM